MLINLYYIYISICNRIMIRKLKKVKDLRRILTALCLSLLCVFYLNNFSMTAKRIEGFAVEVRKKVSLTSKKKFENEMYRQQVFMENYRPLRNSAGINCTKVIINNDQKEIAKSKQFTIKSSNLNSDYYLNITNNCHTFRASRGYIKHPLSKMEYEFPIAFSILVYRDIEQVERLMRLIYRPHNFYCIHMDYKMETNKKEAFRKIANCLNNVFIIKEPVNVIWGDFSLLEAELLCMKTLGSYKQWKYYINLTGQEFPLKTNRQLVAILKALDGANVVYGSLSRTLRQFSKRWSMVKAPPPHNLTMIKGSMHVAANRNFIDFCLHDRISLDFIDWLKETKIPDESFFSTLNHNPQLGIPGSLIGEPEKHCLRPFFLRYVIWQFKGQLDLVKTCHGKFVRQVCVFGVGDLHSAYNSVGLFANKFYLDFEPTALDCLEELLYDRTWKEYLEDIPIDTSYYSNLDYSKMQSKP
ncbi:N-acetyllactosaminide beta-1,6-N-acetylglucosaminyl-transferase-like [Mercenaria mercenaria]|uniref:N-acetyllactosaminide beta-1,6-N-acetylglucosaminyl-transferase-like n=1 Tax=Mercenaria mercenaria TaxID=6596 RepID=UPI00234E7E19|nr:N-acetyllactosaminide beta-1,6-N-acetylglucosaminyl-transferase-like [Mercenaria mercenaria]